MKIRLLKSLRLEMFQSEIVDYHLNCIDHTRVIRLPAGIYTVTPTGDDGWVEFDGLGMAELPYGTWKPYRRPSRRQLQIAKQAMRKMIRRLRRGGTNGTTRN